MRSSHRNAGNAPLMLSMKAALLTACSLLSDQAFAQQQTVGDTSTVNAAPKVATAGFCGYDSARFCADEIGATWSRNEATTQLMQSPFVTLGDIEQAIKSLGLNTRAMLLEQHNAPHVNHLLNRGASAIAWMAPTSTDLKRESLGHFVVLRTIEANGNAVLLDSQTNELFTFEIEGTTEIPIMVIATESLEPSTLQIATSFCSHLVQSGWTTLAGLLALVFVAIAKRTRSEQ
ncbi:hypothetical protein Pla22_17010 [Rubripirellula amarantea]|uniref:Peptidase C39 domain-containing protein n=1 Tax=Rubripirellula amarantea TaxID=2527999 RepID=A0A5C5WTQ6_9BACT|nr:hypothetical protein [Rubripirellula amarantea]TWT54066.1 hypothetical protein Pla22_17010 [Rubripirellula amarantea]